jgi:hypothetical protein
MAEPKERYVVQVTRTVLYWAEVTVDCRSPIEARLEARRQARHEGFPWRQNGDEIESGEITIPEDQPRRRRR